MVYHRFHDQHRLWRYKHSHRILGIVAMIGGILIFAIITALMSSIYMSKLSAENFNNFQSQINELTCEIKKLNEKK